MKQHAEKELVAPVLLCDKKGNLNPSAIGYAKKPLFEANLSGHFMRKKRWNKWYVFGEDILLSATISHLDYAVVCSVLFLQYDTQRYFEKTITIPMYALLKMPTSSLGTLHFKHSDINLSFSYTNGITTINIQCPDFDNERLSVQLHVSHLDDDSLNVVIPWSSKLFHLTSKQHCLPTSGIVKIGHNTFTLEEGESFSSFDFGRGVWPRESEWSWGLAGQLIRNKRIALNFGGNWTDGSGMTENAVFVDGQMTKIHEDLIFTHDTNNLMNPWLIQTKFTPNIKVKFTPFFNHETHQNTRVLKNSTIQLVGYFNGYISLHDGTRISIQQMIGCIEHCQKKW